MYELQISYLQMHNILKENKKLKPADKNKLLAKSILNKFGIVYDNNTENLILNKLRKSFTNNYFYKWKLSRNRLADFEIRKKQWLNGSYKPFADVDMQCSGM